MSRIKLEVEEQSLETLIPQYAANKAELDSYKKICDKENAEIKELMANSDQTEVEAGGYVAKYSVSTRETINEEALLHVLRKYNEVVPEGLIKTKEYVDMDALENALYHSELPGNVAAEINSSCFEKKEVVTLRVTKVKKKKEEN